MNTIVSGAAVASAAAIPSAALASQVSFSPGLVARFERLNQRFHAQCLKDRRCREAFDKAFPAAAGTTIEAYRAMRLGDPDYDRVMAVSNAVWDKIADPAEVAEDGSSIPWNEFEDELDALADKIMELSPRSLADLALQARVAAFVERAILDESGPKSPIVTVLKNLCALAGAQWPVDLTAEGAPDVSSAAAFTARTAESDADPIFQLIKEHRRAESKFNRVLTKLSGAQRRFERETGAISPIVECEIHHEACFLGGRGKTLEELAAGVRFVRACTEKCVADSHEKIDDLLASDPDQAARCHAELDRLIARHEEIVGPYLRGEEHLGAAAKTARDKIFGATATSPRGINALLDYAEETDSKGRQIFSDEEDALGFLQVIRRSLPASRVA